ncbi:MAG: hypothetical protein Q9167_001884 [Letrouitia subvulpina]
MSVLGQRSLPVTPTTAEVATSLLLPSPQLPMPFTGSISSVSPGLSSTLSSPATVSTEDPVAGGDSGECQLLGEAAIFVQGALGALALLSLVYKRWRERPQRPIKIWFFDVSKQVFGSILLHIANLLMSMLSSGQLTVTPKTEIGEYRANPCSFYLLNLAIDTTIGIPILIFLLRLLTYGFARSPLGNPPESVESGNYGQPPRATWWVKQSIIYFLGLLGMKACVFVIFKLCPWIIIVGDWALKWTEGNETVQVFFVMLFFPLIMNALQYYIIDSFIKEHRSAEHEPLLREDEEDEHDCQTQNEETRILESEDGDRELDFEDDAEQAKGEELKKGSRHGGNGMPQTQS